MRILVISSLIVLGAYAGCWLGSMAAVNTFARFVPENVSVSELDFAEGMTKTLPDVQLQPAIAVQGTVGVE